MVVEEVECRKCGRKSQFTSSVPLGKYNEHLLSCGHRSYSLAPKKIVVSGKLTEVGTVAETNDVMVFEGELPCLIVYSDQRHVKYINELLSLTEKSISAHGFRPQRLSAEIRSDTISSMFYEKYCVLLDVPFYHARYSASLTSLA